MKGGGGLEERREGVDGGIAYFRLLPFFFTYMTPTVLFYIQVIIQESTILQKSIR